MAENNINNQEKEIESNNNNNNEDIVEMDEDDEQLRILLNYCGLEEYYKKFKKFGIKKIEHLNSLSEEDYKSSIGLKIGEIREIQNHLKEKESIKNRNEKKEKKDPNKSRKDSRYFSFNYLDNNDDANIEDLLLSEEDKMKLTKLYGFDYYNKVLKNPKKIMAPMVDYSDLAFRMLLRKYGADLCYTEMLHSRIFATSKDYRKKYFDTCEEDRPLIIQFCSHEPEYILRAAKLVEDSVDGVDINLGCPQRVAKKGRYGAFLLDNDWDIIIDMIKILNENVNIPVSCKIRILPDPEKTIELAKKIEAAGCQMLAVHGRTKENKGSYPGPPDWDLIKRIKEELSIPVVSNGGLREYADIDRCLEYTGTDGVMSADAILRHPAFFSGETLPNKVDICREYIDLVVKYPGSKKYRSYQIGLARGHIFSILREILEENYDIRKKLCHKVYLGQDWMVGVNYLREILDDVEDRLAGKTVIDPNFEFGKKFKRPRPKKKNNVQIDYNVNFDIFANTEDDNEDTTNDNNEDNNNNDNEESNNNNNNEEVSDNKTDSNTKKDSEDIEDQ